MKLGRMVKKLRLDPNSVIVVNTSDPEWAGKEAEQVVKELGEAINKTKIPNVIVIGAPSLEAVMGANEQFMMRHGWFILKNLARIGKVKINETKNQENTDAKSEDAASLRPN